MSLFSGCGGMDLGFLGDFRSGGHQYGPQPFDIVFANDLNAAATRAYAHNFGGGHHVHTGDVWTLMDRLPARADVVIGGFPCQDISINGLGAGVDGSRSGLYRAMVEVVRRTRPKVFVAENVKGLLMAPKAESLATVLRDFRALGYEVSHQLYNAADYGVPQTRERVFIVGTAEGVKPFEAPSPTHDRDEWVSAAAAIDDLADVPEDKSISHIWSRAKRSPEQGNRRLKADKPGQTIRAECHGNIQWHYALDRRISMREAARIQSFPDDFRFLAGLRETERMVGNAVPPVLAWHIAQQVAVTLDATSASRSA